MGLQYLGCESGRLGGGSNEMFEFAHRMVSPTDKIK